MIEFTTYFQNGKFKSYYTIPYKQKNRIYIFITKRKFVNKIRFIIKNKNQ